MRALFPWARRSWWWETKHRLCFQDHGGSGYTFRPGDLMDMTADELEWHVDRAERARAATAAAIKRAQAAPKGKR